jgi:hypothetical protein
LDYFKGTSRSRRVGSRPGQGGILDDILDRLLIVAVCTTIVDAIFNKTYAASV